MNEAFYSWRAKHFVPTSDYSWKPKNLATEVAIQSELAKYAVAINLSDAVGGIPEPLYCNHVFNWDAAHFDCLLHFTNSHEVALPDGHVRSATTEGAYLSILRQLTSGLIYGADNDGAAYMLSHARIDALESVVDGVQGPVLVAIFYRAEVEALLKRFGKKARAFVGSTPLKERSQLIDDWNSDRVSILIAAPSAMGHGINLQYGSCRTIVWFTHSFDWAQRAQFNARLVRSGQTKTISIVNLVGDAGLDRVVLESLKLKQSSERAILDKLDIRHRFAPVEVMHVAA